MRCSVRKLPETAQGPLSLLLHAFGDAPLCTNEAAYFGPGGQLLCEPCALKRKEDHEGGQTMLALYQQKHLGTIEAYPLRPIDQTPEEAEAYLRARGVDVDLFLGCVHARVRQTMAALTSRERAIVRRRFTNDPKTLAILDEVETETVEPSPEVS